MTTKKTFVPEINESENVKFQDQVSTKSDSINTLLFFNALIALIIIAAVFIMVKWGNIAWLKIAGTRDIVKQELKNLEYEKVWWADNYAVIQKMQLKQIEQYVAQNKGQNGDAVKPADNTAPAAGAEIKTMTQDEVKALKASSYFEWNKDAKISVYEFSDLECPFCIRQYKEGTIKKVLEKFGDKVNTAFKNFPLDFHKNAAKESEAALCVASIAGADKYVDFHNQIFEKTAGNGEGFSPDNLAPLAKTVGVDETKFKECFDWGKMADALKLDQDLGKKYGVTGTPGSVVVNNETGKYVLIAGAYPFDEFETRINELLK